MTTTFMHSDKGGNLQLGSPTKITMQIENSISLVELTPGAIHASKMVKPFICNYQIHTFILQIVSKIKLTDFFHRYASLQCSKDQLL